MGKAADSTGELEGIIREMNYVYDVSQRISEIKPLDLLLDEIMESCKTVMNAEASSLLIYDGTDNNLHFQVATGESGGFIKQMYFNIDEGIAGWVARNRTPLLIEDCYSDSRFNKEFDKQSNFKTKSMICVPMVHKGKLIGVIQVINKKNDGIFNERDLNIFKILASQCAIAIENSHLLEVQIQQEALNRELRTAREIQQNLLPAALPVYSDIRISAKLIPAKQVGGDYYNVYKINARQTLFIVCDVSGKSISAALIVSTIYSAIVTYFELNKNTFELVEFVKCLNRVLIESTTSEKFATCWFGLYDHKMSSLKSLSAGHNTIFIFKEDGSIVELKEGGLFLGSEDFEFEYEETCLQKNDVLLFYTDGVTEAMDSGFNFYGEERLKNIVKENFSSDSSVILEKILQDIKSFVNEAEQSDDITCGIVKVIECQRLTT